MRYFKLFVAIVVLSISRASFANLKIVIIDTGFCETHKKISNVYVAKTYDATNSIQDLKCPDGFLNLARFHGENVLNEFLKNLKITQKIEIYPLMVFDNRGEQKMEYWTKAISHLNSIMPDIVLSAVGIKLEANTIYPKELKSVWFLSAPRISPFIKISDIVFPQILYKNKNIFIFGEYFEGNLADEGLLYRDFISLFEKDSKDHFNGSSYAMAKISNKIINRCNVSSVDNIKKCLLKNSSKIENSFSVFN